MECLLHKLLRPLLMKISHRFYECKYLSSIITSVPKHNRSRLLIVTLTIINFNTVCPRPLLVVPSLLAIKLFGFLWSVETYVKGYVPKLLLADVHIKTVRNTVEDVKFIFTRLTSSVSAAEWH